MLIYKQNNFLYCFIHIPKTAGKTIRNNIKNKTEVIKEYWGCADDFDYAHISYALRNKFCKYDKVLYHTYVRNPYQRLISAYFYKNPINTITDLRIFIKMVLKYYDFSNYHYNFIHYYPSYLFICENTLVLPKDIIIEKIEDNKDFKINIRDISIFLDPECISIIDKVYANDFKLFNYKNQNLII